MEFVPFTAKTRMSGVNFEGHEIRKGAADSVRAYVEAAGGTFSDECARAVERVANQGGTPLVVTRDHRVLGVVYLKDIIKNGVREKFADLRKMGIKTIMVTGDNPVTAAAIAAEAGVDDFLAEATPEGKHSRALRDAPALAQADVARGHEHGHPGGQGGRQHGGSRLEPHQAHRGGSHRQAAAHDPRLELTTFSVANDVAKYFAIIPGHLRDALPGPLRAQHPLARHAAVPAVLSAIIYNALVIVALIPARPSGASSNREVSSGELLRHNLLVWGLGGLVAPFVFIKLIDLALVALGLA